MHSTIGIVREHGLWREPLRQLRRGRGRRETAAAPWAARAPYRPEADFDLMLVPRVPRLAGGRRGAARRSSGSRPSPGSRRSTASGEQSGCGSPTTGSRPPAPRSSSGAERRVAARDLAAGERYARLLLGRQHDQGAAHRPPAQPRDRQRDRRRADAGGRPGRAPQPDLRRRPQHGRGDGRRRQSGRDRRGLGPTATRSSDHFVGACYADYVTASRDAPAARRRRRRGLGRPRVDAATNDNADELMHARPRRRPGGARTVVEDARLGDLRPAQDARPARHRLRQGDLRVRLPARGRRADRTSASRDGTLPDAATTAW